MKRVKETLAVLFLSLVLGSCGSLMDNNILLSIHKGMTQEEVTKLLGHPDYRRFDEQGEQWEYRKGGGIGHYGTTILIDFKNNLVSNLDSFESVPTPPAVAVCPPAQVESTVAPPRPPHHNGHRPNYPQITSDNDFQQLYNKIKQKPFKDEQLDILSLAAGHRWFSCQQCVRLMSIYTFDDDKLKVLQILATRIADKENYDKIINSLDFLSSEDKAKEMLGIPKKR